MCEFGAAANVMMQHQNICGIASPQLRRKFILMGTYFYSSEGHRPCKGGGTRRKSLVSFWRSASGRRLSATPATVLRTRMQGLSRRRLSLTLLPGAGRTLGQLPFHCFTDWPRRLLSLWFASALGIFSRMPCTTSTLTQMWQDRTLP